MQPLLGLALLSVGMVVIGGFKIYRAGRFSLSETEFRALFRRSLRRFMRGIKV